MKPARALRSDSGFTYIAVLVTVVIMGIMSAQAAQVWKTTMQRERETELLFRGMQIRDAMQRYYYGKVVRSGKPPVELKKPQLRELKDLLEDPTSTQKVRYLRPSSLIDPMTLDEWGLVRDPSQKIIGVASKSEAAPLKQGNFPYQLEPGDFEKKPKYTEWQFIYNRIPQPKVEGKQEFSK